MAVKERTPGKIDINCRDWPFTCKDIQQLHNLLRKSGFNLNRVYSNFSRTVVSASSLGFESSLNIKRVEENELITNENPQLSDINTSLLFHQGTLRSGEHLEADGDVLLLGDVNPGAKVSAGGDVMIWGRLRGIAHAGKFGNNKKKIIALELRPLQLRIANEIARGPADQPEIGLAEEALIDSGKISIQPAKTKNNLLKGL